MADSDVLDDFIAGLGGLAIPDADAFAADDADAEAPQDHEESLARTLAVIGKCYEGYRLIAWAAGLNEKKTIQQNKNVSSIYHRAVINGEVCDSVDFCRWTDTASLHGRLFYADELGLMKWSVPANYPSLERSGCIFILNDYVLYCPHELKPFDNKNPVQTPKIAPRNDVKI